MNLAWVIAAGTLGLGALQLAALALFYAFGERQQQARPEPPEGHT